MGFILERGSVSRARVFALKSGSLKEKNLFAKPRSTRLKLHSPVKKGIHLRYSIADIALFAWIRNLFGFYEAGELVKFEKFSNVTRVLAAFVARPTVAKGREIPKRG